MLHGRAQLSSTTHLAAALVSATVLALSPAAPASTTAECTAPIVVIETELLSTSPRPYASSTAPTYDRSLVRQLKKLGFDAKLSKDEGPGSLQRPALVWVRLTTERGAPQSKWPLKPRLTVITPDGRTLRTWTPARKPNELARMAREAAEYLHGQCTDLLQVGFR